MRTSSTRGSASTVIRRFMDPTRLPARRCWGRARAEAMGTILMLTLALLLLARSAMAQAGPATAAQAAAVPAGYNGTIDFGGLFTGTDGDAARYERYRDVRDGVYSNVKV